MSPSNDPTLLGIAQELRDIIIDYVLLSPNTRSHTSTFRNPPSYPQEAVCNTIDTFKRFPSSLQPYEVYSAYGLLLTCRKLNNDTTFKLDEINKTPQHLSISVQQTSFHDLVTTFLFVPSRRMNIGSVSITLTDAQAMIFQDNYTRWIRPSLLLRYHDSGAALPPLPEQYERVGPDYLVNRCIRDLSWFFYDSIKSHFWKRGWPPMQFEGYFPVGNGGELKWDHIHALNAGGRLLWWLFGRGFTVGSCEDIGTVFPGHRGFGF